MSNIERLKHTCLMEANGDRDLAYTILARKALAWWNAMSPGYVREHPVKPLAIDPKAPLPDPVLLSGE